MSTTKRAFVLASLLAVAFGLAVSMGVGVVFGLWPAVKSAREY